MNLNKWFRRTAGMALVCASVVAAAPLSGPGTPVVQAQAADAGGEFHALTPTRILDTRPGERSINDVAPIGFKKLVQAPRTDRSGEFDFSPLGEAGVPEDVSDVLAIVANVTVTEPNGDGWLAVYPSGFEFGGPNGTDTLSSLINFEAGGSVPNMAIVGVGADGNITVNGSSQNGSRYHVIIDILGFISTSQYDAGGARLEIVAPGRVLNTLGSTPIGPKKNITLQVRGVDTLAGKDNDPIRSDIVPDRATVTAVLVNLTLVNNSPVSTYVTAAPDPVVIDPAVRRPSSSNVDAGATKATTTIVPINAAGQISLYNNAGNLHLIVDVLGYFEAGVNAGNNRGRVVPLEAPFRSFNTRDAEFGPARLQHGSEEEWSFDNFVGSVVLNPGAGNESTAPAQQGLLGNLTAIDLNRHANSPVGPNYSSYLKLTPADAEPARVSNVNFTLGETVPNMSLVKYGPSDEGQHVVKAYNNYGQIHYLLDVFAIVLA